MRPGSRIDSALNADLVGERGQTNFRGDRVRHWMDESFGINLRNHM